MQKDKYFTNEFSYEVWDTTYRAANETTIEDTWSRVAKAIAGVETDKKQKLWENKFFELLEGFKFIPGGRILANAGRNVNATLINCFVSPKPDCDIDSLDGIMTILTDQAKTLKSEGGWGLNFSFIRPRGSYIKGIGVRTPGAVKYMELFDKSSEIITEGPGIYELEFEDNHSEEKKKIRKGAMMSMLSIYHPDIEEFIRAKQTSGRLTKMNMSVAMSDTFMNLISKIDDLIKSGASKEEIERLDKWQLIFPDTTFEKYKTEWDGNFEGWLAKGYPVNVYRTVKATDIWNLIMSSTYNRAEPGIMFIDRANRTFAANYVDGLYIDCTNPCLTGDTKVAVADGRTNVTIKELADAGKDIPVLACDNDGNIITKMMRHPRITGYNKDIYRVTLDDGNHIDCTSNHKFRLSDGTYKEVKDLSIGVALHTNTLSVEECKRYLAQEVLNTEITSNLQLDSVHQLCEEAKSQGYEAKIDNDIVLVKRVCEECGKEHFVPFTHREIAFCSQDCLNTHLNKEKRAAKTTNTDSDIISAKDWPVRFVSSIEYIGKQDVYTGTVDDVHNYCVGMFETVNEDGHTKFYMLNNMQCGEQCLPKSGCCNLGSINLTQYIRAGEFALDAFKEDIATAVRFLDNVLDIANLPLDTYNQFAKNYRRIGLGIMGLGSALMMLGIKYGSEESIEWIHNILNIYNKVAIKTSIDLGVEKGSYKDFDCGKHLKNILNFYPNMSTEDKDEIGTYLCNKNAMRHTALFSIQPTGNTGCLANNVSGGVEPVFSLGYIRTANVPVIPEHIKNKCPAFWEGDMSPNEYFKHAGTDKDPYLEYIDEYTHDTYIITKDRGICKRQTINDYARDFLVDESADYVVLANELTVDEHLAVLEACAKHVDSAISKTINVKNDYPFEAFKDIYLKAYKGGYVKGVTTYRDGSMIGVLSTNETKDNKDCPCMHKSDAVKRPKELDCKLHLLNIKGVSYYVIVGFLGEDPYEVFMGENSEDIIDDDDGEVVGHKVIFKSSMNNIEGKMIKKANKQYVFTSKDFIYYISRKDESDEKATITSYSRILSCALKHGTPIKSLVEQMEKTSGSFAAPLKVITRVLKKYIKDGEEVQGEVCPECGGKLVRKEGCKSCVNCGWSACG